LGEEGATLKSPLARKKKRTKRLGFDGQGYKEAVTERGEGRKACPRKERCKSERGGKPRIG